jgi:hypothetical protein
MAEVLDILARVQALDEEIKETDTKLNRIPDRIAELEKQIETAKSDFQEKKNRLQEIKKTYKMKEVDFAENETKINKLNSQTFAVKTNEEYRAIINEVDYLKNANKEIEDEMLKLLEEEEQLKETTEKVETETKDFISRKEEEISNSKREKIELTEKQKQAQMSFEENFSKLSDDIKEMYKRITKVRGQAVCLITDNTCTGCYSNLTHQFMNELKKRNKVLLCDNCGRILIYTIYNK